MPLVGLTNSGRCSRASRSARSWAKAAPLASSSECTLALATGVTVTIWMPLGRAGDAPPSGGDLCRRPPRSAADAVSGGLIARVRGRRGGAGGHRGDQDATLEGAGGRLAVLRRCAAMTSVMTSRALSRSWTQRRCPSRRIKPQRRRGRRCRAGRRARVRAAPRQSSSKALSRKSRSSRPPNSLNGMMSVTSLG